MRKSIVAIQLAGLSGWRYYAAIWLITVFYIRHKSRNIYYRLLFTSYAFDTVFLLVFLAGCAVHN